MAEPGLKRTKIVALKRCFNSATAVVAGNNDIFHFEVLDCILNHSKDVDIGGRGNVGDIAVDENFAGLESHDLIGRHPGVCASYPQVLGGLHFD